MFSKHFFTMKNNEMRNGNGTERCLTDKCSSSSSLASLHSPLSLSLSLSLSLYHTHLHTHMWVKKDRKNGVKKLKFVVKERIFFAKIMRQRERKSIIHFHHCFQHTNNAINKLTSFVSLLKKS